MEGIGEIADRWFLRVLEGYPEQTAQFMRAQADPFRNPAGAALRRALPVLVRHVLGVAEPEAQQALDAIIRLRAVQDLSPSQAVGFVFYLREVLGEQGTDEAIQRRIDDLSLAAFEAYMRCREQIAQIRANEMARSPRVR